MKKTRGKLQFFIFRKIFAPLEAKMMKNDKKNKKMKKKNEKKMKKKWKKLEENCNFSFFGKLQFSSFFFFFSFFSFFSFFFIFFIFFSFFNHFFIIFHHFSSFFINSTTGSKNDKKMIKNMIKKWKKLEENCNFLFFGKFLHHWNAKMMKNDKKLEKNEKNMKQKWKIKW